MRVFEDDASDDPSELEPPEREAVPALPQEITAKFEILEQLGSGGMGTVYKVRHRHLDEIRVIKIIRAELARDPSSNARFLKEARVAKQLRHPNIAQLIDFDITPDGSPYLVTEFVEGQDLRKTLRSYPLGMPALLAADIGVQVLSALSAIHGKGYVHRDVSPENIILSRAEDRTHLVKLIDFGLVKSLATRSGLTATGGFTGKIHYASPEQFGGSDGFATVDHRSDLYSVGVVLYELMTAVRPIAGTSFATVAIGHLYRAPLPFEETDPSGRVPPLLRDIVTKALSKDPAERHPNAQEFMAELRAAARALEITASEAKTDWARTISLHGEADDEEAERSTVHDQPMRTDVESQAHLKTTISDVPIPGRESIATVPDLSTRPMDDKPETISRTLEIPVPTTRVRRIGTLIGLAVAALLFAVAAAMLWIPGPPADAPAERGALASPPPTPSPAVEVPATQQTLLSQPAVSPLINYGSTIGPLLAPAQPQAPVQVNEPIDLGQVELPVILPQVSDAETLRPAAEPAPAAVLLQPLRYVEGGDRVTNQSAMTHLRQMMHSASSIAVAGSGDVAQVRSLLGSVRGWRVVETPDADVVIEYNGSTERQRGIRKLRSARARVSRKGHADFEYELPPQGFVVGSAPAEEFVRILRRAVGR